MISDQPTTKVCLLKLIFIVLGKGTGITVACIIIFGFFIFLCCCCNKNDKPRSKNRVLWIVQDESVQGLPPYMEAKSEVPTYNKATQEAALPFLTNRSLPYPS